MITEHPRIILITGIMASGKSTVAQLLAERFGKSVHLRGDMFRKMIVNNRSEVTPNPEEGEIEQLLLRHRLTAQAADLYFEAGFTVIVQDVIIGPMLQEFISFVRNRPLDVVVLCPNKSVVAQREAARTKKGYGIWTVEALDNVLRKETLRTGMWLDSSNLTPEETVDEILGNLIWKE
ncbi:MAG: AAA family ATPase [Paenibacillus macerans]|uniref:AAA family ATPase n=1 Tax=Paenibacillus macerans TaxID=44252 RepID=A0A090ZIJ9_PAEMA|nr:AAA family ATPase [Paenibacillus macerans]KFN10462.1 zeta toxin family protein [Paenibacillus macerans]MBS5912246.1 AAA family ATPase [Paenibacillus macerans]MCY7557102.1 AAA family ATPase [Paenibacillus macerans]MDU7474825.1 AAA family ATPase [Paenibacillus macerans]MEC0139423.1 AAA family ATPase [Paenibacillus macerans]